MEGCRVAHATRHGGQRVGSGTGSAQGLSPCNSAGDAQRRAFGARCRTPAAGLLLALLAGLAGQQVRCDGAPRSAAPGAAAVRRSWPHDGRLQLRGGGDAVKPPAALHKVASRVDTLAEEETKPDLKRHPSRLVLDEGRNATAPVLAPKMAYRIDGREVTEAEYNSRLKGVTVRALDSWISDSDRGGYKEGVDVIVPDHCSSVPEAVARVAHEGTVYIRKGTYKWEGVLVVQKHMHLRGEVAVRNESDVAVESHVIELAVASRVECKEQADNVIMPPENLTDIFGFIWDLIASCVNSAVMVVAYDELHEPEP